MNRYNIAGVMAILTLAVLLTVILIVACGPDAQTGQEGAAPTDAPVPADAPTPPVTWEPEPTPVILPAYDYPKLDDRLDLQIAVYQNQRVSVSGQAEPRAFKVYIWTHGPTQREEVTSFLDSHNIVHTKPTHYPGLLPVDNDIMTSVPVQLLENLNAQPGVRGVELREMPYPVMDEGLNELAAQYAAGLMPNQDANPTFTFLDIGIDSKEFFDDVRRFLKNNGAIMRYTDSDADEFYTYTPYLTAFVPVALLEPLATMSGVNSVYSLSYPVPERVRYTLPPIETITPTLPPFPKFRSESKVSGEGVVGE